MACVENLEDAARCGDVSGKIESKAITEVASIIGTAVGIGGGFQEAFKGINNLIGALGASGGSVVIGAIAAVVTVIFFIVKKDKNCNRVEGTLECFEGVVVGVYPSLNTTVQKLLPFLGIHKRIDVLVRRKYWSVVDDFSAKVFCYDSANTPRIQRSPIIRCYEFTEKVCNASDGAMWGAVIGAVAGAALGNFLSTGVVGCLNIIFCLIGLVVSFLVAAVGAVAGATVGSHGAIGSTNTQVPVSASDEVISVGHLVRIKGNMIRREDDEGANVIWWIEPPIAAPTIIHSNPNPNEPRFSYCDLDEYFTDELFGDEDC